MEAQGTQQKLQYLVCNVCDGESMIRGKNCPQCHGKSIVGFLDGYLLYAGKNFDPLHVTTYSVQRAFNLISTIALIVGTVGGFASLIYFLYLNQIPAVFSINFWTNTTSSLVQYFWVSLFFVMYLLYKWSRSKELSKTVVSKKYTSAAEMPRIPLSWEEVSQYPKKYVIDVTQSLSKEAIKTLTKAVDIGHKYKAAEMLSGHLLASLLTLSKNVKNIIARLQIPFDGLVDRLNGVLIEYPEVQEEIRFTARSQKLLLRAYKEAYEERESQVDVKELFQVSVAEDEKVKEVFFDLEVTEVQIAHAIAWMRINSQLSQQYNRYRQSAKLRSKSGLDRALTSASTPYLNKFGEDLTLLAKLGYLDLVIGRKNETAELFRIFEGSSQKSLILVGGPGVGKTAFVEGLAQKIIGNDVPDFLKEKRLVSLSVPRLISGASATEAQERVLRIVNEVARAKNVILYIDNVQELMGITTGGEESLELSEVLAEAVQSNYFYFIASTTPQEYAKYIQKSTLGGLLQKVELREVDRDEAIQILEGKVGAIEHKNKIFFSYQAIAAAVDLSSRYIHDKHLPQKALEILEEVAVFVKQNKGIDHMVTEDDVASMLSQKLNMPVAGASASEADTLLHLEETLHQRVIGQDEAVTAVATALKRARAELRDENRPIANLLFLGPTGVGKTELTKAIAETYFGSENNMVRLDMSEYQDQGSINKLIGSAATPQGVLTEAVKKNPFTIVLLDELEKAHPDILNAFLQVMEDGRLSDATGYTVDFTNTIIIATSNAGSRYIQDQIRAGNTDTELIKRGLLETELRAYFKPEFINRFDNVIVFKPLEMEEIRQITRLMLAEVESRLEEKGIHLRVTDDAIAELAEIGFDPQFGARPLRRAIQDRVDNALADYLLQGKISRRDVAILETGGAIRIEKAKEL